MRYKIEISDCGEIIMPAGQIRMNDCEIAELLGVMLPNVRAVIKRLLNSRPLIDCSGGIVKGNKIVPEYFGLDVVITIAFQMDSYKADIFRKWVIRNITQNNVQPIFITLPKDKISC